MCALAHILFYVPQPRKLVFPLQLRVKECCIFHYRGIQCRNWTAHAHIVLQWNAIFFLFFFFSLLLRTALAPYWQSPVHLNCVCVYYNALLLHKIENIKMAGSIRKISSGMGDNHGNFDLFRLDSSVRRKTRTIRVITRLALNTRRTDRASASISCEHCRSSRNNPHYAPRHIIYCSNTYRRGKRVNLKVHWSEMKENRGTREKTYSLHFFPIL